MKRPIAVLLCVLIPAGVAQDLTQQEILQQLKTLQQQVRQQQQIIEDLQKQLQHQPPVSRQDVSRMVKEEMDRSVDEKVVAAVKENSLLGLGANSDGLELKGDLRLRYEHKEGGDSIDQQRFRTRFRLGGVWTNETESWEIGAGLATGETKAMDGAAGATSTNDTWSKNLAFETGDLYLDYAYATHRWDRTSLTMGQQKNPFENADYLWDSDVRPAGFTGRFDANGFFATAGFYDVGFAKNTLDDHALMAAGQVGARYEDERFDAMLAAAYYHFNDGFADGAAAIVGHPKYTVNPDYDYRIGDLYGTVGTRVRDVKIGLLGEIWQNFGADGAVGQVKGIDPDGNDLGCVLGLSLGYGAFKIGYDYVRIEADSLVAALKDSDFSGALGISDVKGHVLKASYKVTDHFSLGLEADLVEHIERDATADKDLDLYQVDLKYKF